MQDGTLPRPGNTDSPGETLPQDIALEIDRAGEAFEAAWRQGRRPRIEDHLDRTRPFLREAQLRLLLDIELELRRGGGELPAIGEYLARFPGEADLVERAFRDETPAATEPAETIQADGPDSYEGGGPREGIGGARPRYETIRRLGAGGLGEVFVARDNELRREVALKTIRMKYASLANCQSRFDREARITGELEHSGIVAVHSLSRDEEGRPYYAMRLIRGVDFKETIRAYHAEVGGERTHSADRAVAFRELLRAFVATCEAVAFAHDRGVIHRDLKPANVMIGPFGEVLVVDWGMARRIGDEDAGDESGPGGRFGDPEVTLPGDLLGSPGFMSPEQACGRIDQLGPTSDVYSLGGMLYNLLAGQSPLAGYDPSSDVGHRILIDRICKGDIKPPRKVSPAAPAALEAVCLKAMSIEPGDRYATAAALAGDVKRWLADEPVSAYKDPIAVRLARRAKRHRTASVALATALVSAVIALGAIDYQISRANVAIARERNVAVEARKGEAVARAEAEANFQQILEAVNGILLQVAQSDLPNVPGTVALRRRVAAQASGYLASLWSRRPDDPEICFQAARGYRELANILRLLREPESEVEYGRAVELLRRAVEGMRDEPRYRDFLAETLIDVAEALRVSGKTPASEPLYRESLELARALRSEFPDDPAYHRTEARALYNLAGQRLESGDLVEARDFGRKAAGLFRPLADSVAPGPTDRLELSLLLNTLGASFREANDLDEAEAALEESSRRTAGLLKQVPNDVDLRFLAANAALEKGRALDARNPRRRGPAGDALDRSVSGLLGLVKASPEVVHYRQYLAEALLARAEHRVAEGWKEGAADDLEEAKRRLEALLAKAPGHPIYSGLLGRALGQSGRLQLPVGDLAVARTLLGRAVELQQVALGANPTSPWDLKALRDHEKALDGLRPSGQPRP